MSIHTGVIVSKALERIRAGEKEQRIIGCFEGVNACGFNRTGNYLKCIACRKTLKKIRNEFDLDELPRNQKISVQDGGVYDILNLIKESKNMEDIKSIKYRDAPLGYSIVSSFVSTNRTTEINKKTIKTLSKLALSYAMTFDGFFEIFKFNPNIEKLTVFNGRFELTNAAQSVAKLFNCKIEILEVTGVDSKLINFGEHSPFSIGYSTEEILRLWDKERPNTESNLAAHEFYRRKIHGLSTNDVSYTKSQSKTLRPDEWGGARKKIVIFGSSMDEFYSIGKEWEFSFFKTQAEGVALVSKLCEGKDDIQIYFRMHPNLSYLDNQEIRDELKLGDLPNVIVIPPESKITSYGILNEAELIITFGSTIGIEALFHYRKTILIGKSFYMNLPGVICVNSERDFGYALNSLLYEENFAEMCDLNMAHKSALMYSNYLLSRGYSCNLIEFKDKFSIVDGVMIKPSLSNRFLIILSGIVESFESYNAMIIRLRRSNSLLAKILLRMFWSLKR